MRRRYSKTDLLALSSDLTATLPPPKRRKNEESVMQRALICWWHDNCGLFGVHEWLLFSVPNGGNWDAKRGSIMRAEGQRKGVPDLFLAVPMFRVVQMSQPIPPAMFGALVKHPSYSGLFLELKIRTGVVSPEQETFHEQLRRTGYKVSVVRTLGEAIDTITSYLT